VIDIEPENLAYSVNLRLTEVHRIKIENRLISWGFVKRE
jgi:hypothetical protein